MTITAIALKVVASALKIYPQFNASIDMEREEIVYKQYVNIGVATDTERGLLVPVLRDVDKKNIVELAARATPTGPIFTAIDFHRLAKWPVSYMSTRSPGDSVLTSAASHAPVPEAG